MNIKHYLKPFMRSQNSDWKIKLHEEWQTIMGNLAQHTSIERIYRDTIVLGVYDSCWLQELYLLSETLLQTINNHLNKQYLKQIRFVQISKKKLTPHKKENPAISHKPPKKVVLTNSEQEALARIQDSSLKNALRSFLVRCHQEK